MSAAVFLSASACGDIGSLRVELEFPDSDTELRTRALLYRARQVPDTGTGCGALWAARQPVNLRQRESVVEYPHRTDIRALGIDLAPFDVLTIFVYAYTSLDVANSNPIAGGCVAAAVSGDDTGSIRIALEPSP